MKWLSLVGKFALAGLQAITGFGPMIGAMIPGTKDDQIIAKAGDTLMQVSTVVQMVEAIGQAASTPMPGAEKLKVATPLVAQIILSSTMLAQHKIANEALFRQGCASIASGMADVLNSLKGDPDTIDKG
jgi:hypothetical protein